MLKRLRTLARMDWWRTAPIGDVDLQHRQVYHAARDHIAAFSNVAQHALPIESGGVHVAVGFLDLGELAETVRAWRASRAAAQCALAWHGFDASAHACANSAVIARMLEAPEATDDILQVRASARPCSANALCGVHSHAKKLW